MMGRSEQRLVMRPLPLSSVPDGRAEKLWLYAAIAIVAVVLVPIAALLAIAVQGSGDLWPHLVRYVLPQSMRETALLLAGVAAIVIPAGTGLAWLTTAYDFAGRRMIEWALLLPLSIPTYIVAYSYVDLLHPVGPVQRTVRAWTGAATPRDLWFPEIRSLGGCIVLFALVLYPYVYLAVRALYLMQAANVIEAARTLGASPARRFYAVAIPLARPAIAVGTSLALMEALSDIGASEFLGVQTLSRSIFATWTNRSNLPGAAQISLLLIAIVLGLVAIERWGRRQQRFVMSAPTGRRVAAQRLHGLPALAAILACLLPIALGFAVPVLHLASEAVQRLAGTGLSLEIARELSNTLVLSGFATLVAAAAGLVVAFSARVSLAPLAGSVVPLASLGYALPGTVLAVGLVGALGKIDGVLAELSRLLGSAAPGQVMLGSATVLVYAYAIRFLAMTAGGADSGLAKIPRTLDGASRTLKCSVGSMLLRVHLPLVRPALVAASLLVLVDCIKELPLTLLLRPLSFETLATHVYGEAARGSYEDGAVAALCIVLAGLIPVILLARTNLAQAPANGADLRSRPMQ